MIRDDENREHTIRLSDEQLAELERISERSEVSHSAELLSGSATQRTIDIQGADHVSAHRHYYTLIDALSAPIRSALNGIATIPTLPDYEELEEIGRGGMGIVYRGRHKKTLRLEAIKVIRTDCMPGSVQHLTRRLRLEAQLAARVAHEHIVPVYQTGEVDGCPWFSMQLVEGTSLRGRLRDSRLPPQQAAMIAEQIARAVNKMHRHGILHGDIKPNNILIERDGGRPLITDFGLADLIETPDADLGIAGTPAYMAPELARAAGQKSTEGSGGLRTVASDVYSLGATLWSSLTGKFPCADGLPLREQLNRVTAGQLRFDEEYPSDVPVELRRICRKCLAEDPDVRFTSAGEMADALSLWQNRMRWNRYFPGLRRLLVVLVAPAMAFHGVLIWWLLRMAASEGWIWASLVIGYVPLFMAFGRSQTNAPSDGHAPRELWSMWIGHLTGSVACLIGLRILCHPDLTRTMSLFYPVWAGLSCSLFFAKSANFWLSYRWIGGVWAMFTILLAMTPTLSPILFGCAAALTCVIIARGDDAFQTE